MPKKIRTWKKIRYHHKCYQDILDIVEYRPYDMKEKEFKKFTKKCIIKRMYVKRFLFPIKICAKNFVVIKTTYDLSSVPLNNVLFNPNYYYGSDIIESIVNTHSKLYNNRELYEFIYIKKNENKIFSNLIMNQEKLLFYINPYLLTKETKKEYNKRLKKWEKYMNTSRTSCLDFKNEVKNYTKELNRFKIFHDLYDKTNNKNGDNDV